MLLTNLFCRSRVQLHCRASILYTRLDGWEAAALSAFYIRLLVTGVVLWQEDYKYLVCNAWDAWGTMVVGVITNYLLTSGSGSFFHRINGEHAGNPEGWKFWRPWPPTSPLSAAVGPSRTLRPSGPKSTAGFTLPLPLSLLLRPGWSSSSDTSIISPAFGSPFTPPP